jgi:NhaP-type Na+/H+ or K+/H+ antiporter
MRNALLTIAIGIVIWAVALVILIATGASTEKIYTCIVGIVLGLIGLRYTFRRAKREGWN